MKKLAVLFAMFLAPAVVAQTAAPNEKRVSLNEAAVALDPDGASVLEATLQSTALNGTSESPVSNIRIVVRNSGSVAYSFVSGVVTFYDSTGVRCGEGVFKAEALAAGESFETDTPGIRIRCTAASWRLVASSLIPRVVVSTATSARLEISVDGEAHPLQLDKPLTLTVGDKKRTIVVRNAP